MRQEVLDILFLFAAVGMQCMFGCYECSECRAIALDRNSFV